MKEIILRPAEPSEAGVLTALTRRSKGHWGYDQEILDRMQEILSISSATIRDGYVVVAEQDGLVAGYYQLSGKPPHGELADMFLEPTVIGTGLGRALWEHAVGSARSAGFYTLTWESDPHAEQFYLHMSRTHRRTRGRARPRASGYAGDYFLSFSLRIFWKFSSSSGGRTSVSAAVRFSIPFDVEVRAM